MCPLSFSIEMSYRRYALRNVVRFSIVPPSPILRPLSTLRGHILAGGFLIFIYGSYNYIFGYSSNRNVTRGNNGLVFRRLFGRVFALYELKRPQMRHSNDGRR